jgi:hypothetical protein
MQLDFTDDQVNQFLKINRELRFVCGENHLLSQMSQRAGSDSPNLR